MSSPLPSESPLTQKERRLLLLALHVVRRDAEGLRALRDAAPEGEPDREWRETLLQTHLFAGFPSVVEALRILGQGGGLGEPTAREIAPEADDVERGGGLFSAIYGDNATAVRGRIAAGHPLFERWVLGYAYGRVLTREGLAPRMRELQAVVCLAASGLERQLASHVRGALAVGATRLDLDQALELAAPWIGADAHGRATRVLARYGSCNDE